MSKKENWNEIIEWKIQFMDLFVGKQKRIISKVKAVAVRIDWISAWNSLLVISLAQNEGKSQVKNIHSDVIMGMYESFLVLVDSSKALSFTF